MYQSTARKEESWPGKLHLAYASLSHGRPWRMRLQGPAGATPSGGPESRQLPAAAMRFPVAGAEANPGGGGSGGDAIPSGGRGSESRRRRRRRRISYVRRV